MRQQLQLFLLVDHIGNSGAAALGLFQVIDRRGFFLKRHFAFDHIEIQAGGDGTRVRTQIAGQHDHLLYTKNTQLLERIKGIVTLVILQHNITGIFTVDRDV